MVEETTLRRVVRERCARPSPFVRRHVGQLHRGDARPGQANAPGNRPSDLDEADGLSGARLPALVSLLYETACRSTRSPGAVAPEGLVTLGDGDGRGSAPGADRLVLRAVAEIGRASCRERV